MRVAFITSGYLPVPATNGGAVESIIENYIRINEQNNENFFEIFSIYDENAQTESKKYKNTKINFIKVNCIIKTIDKLIYLLYKNVLKVKKTMSYRYIFQRLYFLWKVSRALKNEDYDKIILENHPTLFLSLKWNKNYKKYEGKYFYHVHNEITNTYGCYDIIKKSRKIICVSNYIREHVIKVLKIDDKNKVVVLKNCVDIEKFSEIDNKTKQEIKLKYNINKEFVILFTGRLSQEKGIRELLKALNNVKDKNYKLLIVGSYFFNTDIKNDFDLLLEEDIKKIEDKVIFTGYIPYTSIQNIYAIADLVILPSIWEDPAPLTIIESMASGLPIITTNSGGIPEYVRDCAIIIKRDEKIVENISVNIENLLKNKLKLKEMSEKSIAYSKDLNLVNFYNNLIKLLS